jgi:Endoribonuclease L-PSP
VTGAPPFDKAGEIIKGPGTIKLQTEEVLEQMKLCLETAGSSLNNVLKCNVYCTSAELFGEGQRSLPTLFSEGFSGPNLHQGPARNGGSTSKSTASQRSDPLPTIRRNSHVLGDLRSESAHHRIQHLSRHCEDA